MTDDITHPDDAGDRSADHQHAVEAGEHAIDALRNGALSHTLALIGGLGAGGVEDGSGPLGNIAQRLP